jgi:hypothetical protein
MRSSGRLLRRVGREFVRNLLWMGVVFGSLGAMLAAATDLSLVGVLAFVGVSVVVLAAIVTWEVLSPPTSSWSGPRDETRLGSRDYPGLPPVGGGWDGGGWDGGGGGGDGGGGGL